MLAPLLSLLLSATPALTLEARGALPEDEVTLEASGLHAPAAPRAGLFLFGHLGGPARSLRALLLRSTDGGAHWTEVLPEVGDSQVLHLHFTGCQGRALVGWTTEGPGELTVYASNDCGATWTARAPVPKALHTEWLHAMEWKDASHATLWLVDTAEEATPPRALVTRDAGRTWAPATQPPPPAHPTTAPRLEALGASGVRWTLTSDTQRTALRVTRQAPGGTPQLRALLPLRWRVSGTRLVPRP